MVTAGSYFGDRDCWGLSHNDFHRVAMQIPENIDVALNTTNNNDPLVLKAGSMFYVWGSSGITISANSSGNASYVAGSTYSYFRPYAVYTSTDFSPVWTSTAITSTGGNGTYYMVAKTGSDTKGQVNIDYLMSSVFTPSYSSLMVGWYGTTAGSTEYRTIARFIMTSGVMSRACVFLSRITDPGYISHIDVYSTGTNIYMDKITCDLGDGKAIKYLQDITIGAISSLTASTWYAIAINQNDGVIYNSSMAGTYSNWTISGNKLNAYSIFSDSYCFMRGQVGSTYHRIIDIYRVSSGSSVILYNIPTAKEPKSYVFMCSTFSTAYTTNTYQMPNMSQTEIDVNSEISTATSYLNYTPVRQQCISIGGSWMISPSSYAVGSIFYYAASRTVQDGFVSIGNTLGRYQPVAASTVVNTNSLLFQDHILSKSDTINIIYFHNSSAAVTPIGSTAHNWLEIIEI